MDKIQTLTALLSLTSLWICIDLYNRIRSKRRYLVPVIVYLLHVLVFYTLRFMTTTLGLFPNYLDYFSFTNWSAVVRLQEVFTIFYFVFILGKYDLLFCEKIRDTRVGRFLWKSGCKQ